MKKKEIVIEAITENAVSGHRFRFYSHRGGWIFFCGSLLVMGLITFSAILTIRYIGALLAMPLLTAVLGADTQTMLADIFSQLANAKIIPDIVVLSVIWLLYTGLWRWKKRIALWLSPLFVLWDYLSGVCFAFVNGVRFCDILLSLARMIGNGLFEVL